MGEHTEYRIYDDCEHGHAEGDPGTTEVRDVGICCEDGYMYSLCYVCHTDDGELEENSPTEQAWPCDAAKAQAKVKELEDPIRKFLKWGEHGGCYTGSDIAMFQGMFERALAGEGVK